MLDSYHMFPVKEHPSMPVEPQYAATHDTVDTKDTAVSPEKPLVQPHQTGIERQ